MIRHSLLTLALIGVAGTAGAQTIIASPPQPSPGDYRREAPGLQPMDQQAEAVSRPGRAASPITRHSATSTASATTPRATG